MYTQSDVTQLYQHVECTMTAKGHVTNERYVVSLRNWSQACMTHCVRLTAVCSSGCQFTGFCNQHNIKDSSCEP